MGERPHSLAVEAPFVRTAAPLPPGHDGATPSENPDRRENCAHAERQPERAEPDCRKPRPAPILPRTSHAPLAIAPAEATSGAASNAARVAAQRDQPGAAPGAPAHAGCRRSCAPAAGCLGSGTDDSRFPGRQS